MRTIVSENKWLRLVKQESKKNWNGTQTIMEFYYEIQHKAEEYIFFLKDGKPAFPKHRQEL